MAIELNFEKFTRYLPESGTRKKWQQDRGEERKGREREGRRDTWRVR